MTEESSQPAAYAHLPIAPLGDSGEVFWAPGSIRMRPGMMISRNMVIVRRDGVLTLLNPVRLDDEGLAALDALGRVEHVVRLGFFHGLDDPFYVDRYGAAFWAQPESKHYERPEITDPLTEGGELPIAGAELFTFQLTRRPECAFLLPEERLLVTCDAAQHYPDFGRCSLFARVMMPLIGFRKTTLIGGPWKKFMTPEGGSLRPDFERLLALDFDALIAAHGGPCTSGAHGLLARAVDRAFA